MEAEIRKLVHMEDRLRPEFINRIDEIVVFHQISRARVRDIVDIQISRLRPRLAKRHITLQLTDAARDLLAEMCYDPQFGARPLKRVIQREVENRIAHGILEGTIRDGEIVEIGVKEGKLVMESIKAQAPEAAHAD
jgi:ATP-dependent Clp protease ATP-binding subunit ClpB